MREAAHTRRIELTILKVSLGWHEAVERALQVFEGPHQYLFQHCFRHIWKPTAQFIHAEVPVKRKGFYRPAVASMHRARCCGGGASTEEIQLNCSLAVLEWRVK
jgi:hypothetical protein